MRTQEDDKTLPLIRHTRPMADTLTILRVFLGLYIAGLGLFRGKNTLAAVVVAVIISWLSDLFDGPLARHDRTKPDATWIGEHDAEADLATSLGVAAYLILDGRLAAWMGVGLSLVTLVLWSFHSHQLAWPFYVMPYAILQWHAFQEVPTFGWITAIYLGITLVVRWRRLVEELLPQFFGAVISLHPAHSQGIEKPRNSKR